MQVLPKRFPPLATRKHSAKIKLQPTLLALTRTRPHSRPQLSHSRKQTPLSQDDNRQEPFLRRQPTSFKSVSSARNRSCDLQGEGDRLIKEESRVRGEVGVSAKSWVVYEMREGRVLCGKKEQRKREMASLTKMMNLATLLQLLERAAVDPRLVTVTATRNATALNGTSAELKRGAAYSLYDLLFAMMLPSGNDAAYLIAEVGGVLVRLLREESPRTENVLDPLSLQEIMRRGSNVSLFLREMNRLAAQLGMKNSNFANPHGLSNPANYSTALDLARLSAHAMSHPLFRTIVSTRKHCYRYWLPPKDKENMHPNQP